MVKNFLRVRRRLFIPAFEKRLDQIGQAVLLEQCCYPINQTVNHACGYTIDNHRACNREHLRANTENEALCRCQYRPQ